MPRGGGTSSSSGRSEEVLALVRYSGVKIGALLSHGHSYHRIRVLGVQPCVVCHSVVWDPFSLSRACKCITCGILVHRKCASSSSVLPCSSKKEFDAFFQRPTTTTTTTTTTTSSSAQGISAPDGASRAVSHVLPPSERQEPSENIRAFYAALPNWTPFRSEQQHISDGAQRPDSELAASHSSSSSNLKTMGKLSFAGGVVGGIFGGPVGGLIGVKIGVLVGASELAGRALWKRAQEDRRRRGSERTLHFTPTAMRLLSHDIVAGDGDGDAFSKAAKEAVEAFGSNENAKTEESFAVEEGEEESDPRCFFANVASTTTKMVLDVRTLPGATFAAVLSIFLERRAVTSCANADLSDQEKGRQSSSGDEDYDTAEEEDLMVVAGAQTSLKPHGSWMEVKPSPLTCTQEQEVIRGGDADVIAMGESTLQDARRLLDEVSSALLRSCPWLYRSHAAMIAAVTGVDRAAARSIYRPVFECMCDMHRSKDLALVERLSVLRSSEDCPSELLCSADALQALRALPQFTTCYDKLLCLVEVMELVSKSLEGGSEATADILLISLCKHLIWAEIPQLHAELYFVEQFAREDYWLVGREGYALTSIEAAVTVLMSPEMYVISD
jgi:hypothetical protein